MRLILASLLFVVASLVLSPRLVPHSLAAQEAVTLTTPIVKPATATCQLDTLVLDIKGGRIIATLGCNNGDVINKQYDATTTPTGVSLLSTLNQSNNSAGNSLIKKVYTRLNVDGVVVGTVAGTAQ